MRHPAKFTDTFLPIFYDFLKDKKRILDPFAGTGKIAKIRDFGFEGEIFCNEIEPEWIYNNDYQINHITTCDAENLPFKSDFFDGICTSPTYGNRMADSHNAKDKSRRNTYTHSLGRKLHDENTGKMQWGRRYREKHTAIYTELYRVLEHSGVMVINVSDHIRKGEVMPVCDFHREVLLDIGMHLQEEIEIKTPRMRMGSNANVRVDHEKIFVFTKK